MKMTIVGTCFAALFASGGWLMPHLVHRLGFRMALFYLLLAACSAVLALVRSPARR